MLGGEGGMSGFSYSRIGTKILRRVGWAGEGEATHAHWCPACKVMHDYYVEQPFVNGARWSFNGDGGSPTFTPSMNITIGPFPDGHIERCHYFVTAGRIQYCGDSTHAMAGQTVDLPDVPDEVLKRSQEVER
jgi:hypothetical protein